MFGFGRKARKRTCCSVSETGLVREENQDTVFVDSSRSVLCVSDGMGGGSEGATASRFVCEALSAVAEADGMAGRMSALASAVDEANARIFRYARERGFRQMGATVVVLLFDPDDERRAAICHVGDSRAYRIRARKAELLTRDHTVGNRLGELAGGVRAAGLRSRSNALAHVLTRAIGGAERVEIEWNTVDVAPGDRFLICSDGVHDVVTDERIGFLLSRHESLADISCRLTADVVAGGAPDNYSYVIVEIGA